MSSLFKSQLWRWYRYIILVPRQREHFGHRFPVFLFKLDACQNPCLPPSDFPVLSLLLSLHPSPTVCSPAVFGKGHVLEVAWSDSHLPDSDGVKPLVGQRLMLLAVGLDQFFSTDSPSFSMQTLMLCWNTSAATSIAFGSSSHMSQTSVIVNL